MRSFDRVAEIYDATRALPPAASAAIAEGLVRLLHDVAPAPRVLEIGVGTGRIATPLAAAGVSLVGVDVAPAMLAQLRSKLPELPVAVADALHLPFGAERFDAVLFVHVLHLLDDPVAALREALHVIRPGGVLLVGRTEQVDSPRRAVMRIIGELASEIADVPPTVDWNAPVAAALDTVAAETDAVVTEHVLARWEESTTGAAMLEALAARVYSSSWQIPDAVMPELVRRLTPRVESLFEGLDHVLTTQASFTVEVLGAPREPTAPSPETWHTLARTLLGEPSLSALDITRAAGVDPEQARALWRALGFPPVPDDERIFTRTDADMLTAFRETGANSPVDPRVRLQLTRVVGQSLARVAEAHVLALHGAAPETLAQVLPVMVPRLERFIGYAWRRHLLAALFRTMAADVAPAGHRLVVGFADLVNFTETSQHLTADELAALVERFEAHAYERIPAHGGRIVKTIGDEVMFAVGDAHAAAAIALELAESYEADALPVRVGLASGPTVAYEGDIFGQTVNLAHRLVGLARPGTVLVAEELGIELANDPDFRLRRLQPKLKGIGRVRAWVIRRPDSDEPRRVRRGSAASAPSDADPDTSGRRDT